MANHRGARERILQVATDLFYREGVNNVGIDKIIARAKIAKMTLYAHFKSKDELVLAFLERINGEWSSWLKGRVQELAPDPRRRPLALFDALEEWFKSPGFKGCPFINTTAEVSQCRHPAHRAAWGYKQLLMTYIAQLTREAGMKKPEELAERLLLLVDGAIVRAVMSGDPAAAKLAREAAEAVILKN